MSTETDSTSTTGSWINTVFQAAKLLLKTIQFFTNPVAGGLSLIGVAASLFIGGHAMWGLMFARLDGLIAHSTGQVDFSPLGFANYLLPLDEFLTHLSVWATIWVLANAIRIIKSFIPTVS